MTVYHSEMTPPDGEQGLTLAECIARGAQGDEAACAALFRRFYPEALRLCFGLLNDLGDAEEVAQDAFVYALRNLARYDPGRAAFRTWLFTIALSRCRNKRRRKWLEVVPLERALAQPAGLPRVVEAAMERRGLRREVWEALQALSAPLREAVLLRYLGGFRYEELGRVLKCNPKTAESRVRLGLTALRRTMLARGVEYDLALAELSA
jgi:RNA polymerase sigma-70 factor (ECF subfamily)